MYVRSRCVRCDHKSVKHYSQTQDWQCVQRPCALVQREDFGPEQRELALIGSEAYLGEKMGEGGVGSCLTFIAAPCGPLITSPYKLEFLLEENVCDELLNR